MLAYRGLGDDQGGNSWTLSFSSNEGAVEELVCVTEVDFVGNCEVCTMKDSRFIFYTVIFSAGLDEPIK